MLKDVRLTARELMYVNGNLECTVQLSTAGRLPAASGTLFIRTEPHPEPLRNDGL